MKTTTISAPIAEIRKTISQIRQRSLRKQEVGESYKVDRSCATCYLEMHRKFEKKVYGFLKSLRESGEKVIYVDICGRATLSKADINYSFSLQGESWAWAWKEEAQRVVGDIFSAKDFYGFLQKIKTNGHQPSFVTCVPVAGLSDYASSDHMKVIHQRLENNLRAMIRLVRPGGFIYVSSFMSEVFGGENATMEFFNRIPYEERKTSLFIKGLCKSMRCSVDIAPVFGGTPDFLIRKWLR